MRKALLGLTVGFALAGGIGLGALGTAGTASAHVHGITPLLGLSCNVDLGTAGANATNGTPADDANGGPIKGLIPRDTGNAPLTGGPGTGGFGKTTANCP